MINNLFKALFLIVAISATILLFNIYKVLESNKGIGRYQTSSNNGIFDSKEGIEYGYAGEDVNFTRKVPK